MSGQVAIFSTLSSSVSFVLYKMKRDLRRQLNVEDKENGKKRITIDGGANVASNIREGKKIFTPKGVCTRISEHDYNYLKDHDTFQHFLKEGYFSVDDSGKKSVEKAVRNMEKKDASAQKTPKDHKNEVRIEN